MIQSKSLDNLGISQKNFWFVVSLSFLDRLLFLSLSFVDPVEESIRFAFDYESDYSLFLVHEFSFYISAFKFKYLTSCSW